MNKKEFNINTWLPKAGNDALPSVSDKSTSKPNSSPQNDVEEIILLIESQHIDITSTYADWRNIGFALSEEFGDTGRAYFHRVSKFHPEYNPTECDKQFDNCLKATGQGVTIKTFFHLAQSAGISLSTSSPKIGEVSASGGRRGARDKQSSTEVSMEVIFNTPQIPFEVYNQLPQLLKEGAEMFQDSIEKDVFLIGAITVLSGCLPNIVGIYFDEQVSAHLYAFITAPAGSGKGKLKWAKYLGMAIHKEMVSISAIEKEKYEQELEQYNNLTRNQRQDVEKPKEPKRNMFFIPANSSSSAFIQALSDNNFKGILFETEADTLAGTLKQEWGNFSDVLRKAFHHESTNMFRRKDNEFIEIEDPHLAIALSGTPKQVHIMMPDAENGLFSRFLYYAFEDYSDFKNPFISHQSVNYLDFFQEQGQQVFQLYKELNKFQKPIKFELTGEQADDFTSKFKESFQRNRLLLGNDFNANSRRLGLITFRIAMVLSAIRILESGDISNPLICNETDYQTALNIAFTLEKHAIAVYKNLPNNNLKGIKQKFFDALPNEFDRQGYLKIAAEIGIKEKAAEKYIGQFRELKILNHEHNRYNKIIFQN
ncbi:MAG: DUF3987 domain-containing protein [Salinivirgaceae bacterium]